MRGALWPVAPAAVGLASALVAGGALAQEATPAPASTPAPATAPATENTFVMPTVRVQESAERKEYNTEQSNIARLPKPLVDTPQTVTVVPEKVIEEQNATTVAEALRNVSGITVSAGEGGRQGDIFILRGFSSQTDVFRDGVRDLGWFTRDTFNLGGVEVFFGPSSVLFGRGSTGGAINLVTKKPGRRTVRDVRLTGGTAPSGRLEFDLNQEVTSGVQVRVNGMGQLASVAGRDSVYQDRAGFAPSVHLDLGERTSLEFDYLYQREQGVPDYGQPYYQGSPVATRLGVPRSNFYGVVGSDIYWVNAHVASGRFQHRFADHLTLTDTLRFGRVGRFARPTSPRGLSPAVDPVTIGRERFQTQTNNANLINQTDLRGEFQTGLFKHTANVGLELSLERRNQYRDNLPATGLPTGNNLPADLYNPDPRPDLSAVSPVFSNQNNTRQSTVGVYASEQLEITRYLELLGSLRYDVFSTQYTVENSARTTTQLENKDGLFNWRVGAVLHPVANTSVYGMYGTSANPSAEAGTLANDTVTVAPETSVIYEAGAKASLLNDRLGLNAAVFRIDKTNTRVPNIDNTQPQVLDGAQRVQGVNFGVAGTITQQWKVLANYTQMASRILNHTNPYLVGQQLPNTPRRSLSLWTTVDILPNLTLGGGAVYQDVTVVNNPSSAAQVLAKVPNFWRFDAFASYSLFNRIDLQLNVNNLTNALFYDQYYAGHAVPTATRTAALTARVAF